MRLYQIRRKSDGRFFCGFQPYDQIRAPRRYKKGDPMFESRPGVMYRRIDNVRLNLQWICSPVRWHGWGSRKTVGFKNFDPVFKHKSLSLYEIIVHDVLLQDVQIVKASALFRNKKC